MSAKAKANVERGFIGRLEPCVIKTADDTTAWDNDAYSFLEGECPPTVNKKLWEQSRLLASQGLFEVAPTVYQVRGLDLSNMTLIEGKEGVIVVDPLISIECARAALELYYKHRGVKPVTAVFYSHPHVDHFGGAQGVIPQDRDIPIIAPEGFIEEAVSESIHVGPAMIRRAGFMYGALLDKSPTGQVGCGLGQNISLGSRNLVPPNKFISETGEEMEIDGVKFEFQLVPETEAPCEANFYLPDLKALYVAECATHSIHNITTLRGALVRDAKSWAKHLDETLVMYGSRSEVLFAGHAWPTWGSSEISTHIAHHRDLYAYLHDQTLRMMNLGLTGVEIAETIQLPPSLRDSESTQGYYGSVNSNVKGIYQRYMTWFDGNPVNLWRHTPLEEAKRYVDLLGGVPEVLKRGEQYEQKNDLRFAATLLDHAYHVDPENSDVCTALAGVYEKLGFGAENATWRNFYLSAARMLHLGIPRQVMPPTEHIGNPLAPVSQWLDCLALRVDGLQAAKHPFVMFVRHPERDVRYRVVMSNGALQHRLIEEDVDDEESKTCLVVTRSEFLKAMHGHMALDMAHVSGSRDLSVLWKLMDLCGVEGFSDKARL